jgi:hypothetical protein
MSSRIFRWLSSRPEGVDPRLRLLTVLATLFLLALFLGCMSMNVGNVLTTEDGVLTQSGEVTLNGHKPCTVYYPIPYISTPNLALKDFWDHDDWEIGEQHWDHFSVVRKKSSWGSAIELKWTAKGLRGPPPAAPVVVAPAAESPAPVRPVPVPRAEPALPPRPVPVEQTGR